MGILNIMTSLSFCKQIPTVRHISNMAQHLQIRAEGTDILPNMVFCNYVSQARSLRLKGDNMRSSRLIDKDEHSYHRHNGNIIEENSSNSFQHYKESLSNTSEDHQIPSKNICEMDRCLNRVESEGRCPAHGGSTRCSLEGCLNLATSGGKCAEHSGGQLCKFLNCKSSAVSRGLCVVHSGGRVCRYPNCTKHIASGGLCRSHGGGRRCKMQNCQSSAQSRGLCYVHGGGGRCQMAGCSSSAKKGGLCIAHGGGHRCKIEGCTSSAVSGSLCRAHGGGKRCNVDGCKSSAKTGGLCIAHGGGKRCTIEGCRSSAQRMGLCKAHGGGRKCVAQGCGNCAVSRGFCISHGGGKRCSSEGCETAARKGGYCFAHGRRGSQSTNNGILASLKITDVSSPKMSRNDTIVPNLEHLMKTPEHRPNTKAIGYGSAVSMAHISPNSLSSPLPPLHTITKNRYGLGMKTSSPEKLPSIQALRSSQNLYYLPPIQSISHPSDASPPQIALTDHYDTNPFQRYIERNDNAQWYSTFNHGEVTSAAKKAELNSSYRAPYQTHSREYVGAGTIQQSYIEMHKTNEVYYQKENN